MPLYFGAPASDTFGVPHRVLSQPQISATEAAGSYCYTPSHTQSDSPRLKLGQLSGLLRLLWSLPYLHTRAAKWGSGAGKQGGWSSWINVPVACLSGRQFLEVLITTPSICPTFMWLTAESFTMDACIGVSSFMLVISAPSFLLLGSLPNKPPDPSPCLRLCSQGNAD